MVQGETFLLTKLNLNSIFHREIKEYIFLWISQKKKKKKKKNINFLKTKLNFNRTFYSELKEYILVWISRKKLLFDTSFWKVVDNKIAILHIKSYHISLYDKEFIYYMWK